MTPRNLLFIGASVFLVVLFMLAAFLFSAPRSFPLRSIISVEEGATIAGTAIELEDRGFVRSSILFELSMRILHDSSLIAGDYYFDKKEGLLTVVDRLSSGNYELDPVRVTIPEGHMVAEIGEILKGRYPQFDSERFVEIASSAEGYLFPDTYDFFPGVQPETVEARMRETFESRTADLQKISREQGRSWSDVVIMASLLEEEGSDFLSRRMIADILWRRLRDDMLLQVDATFGYLIGKGSAELTQDDLKIDSPYNTYIYRGLPPTPITNPGLESIEAALNPIPNTFVYYLADSDGVTRYSTTFEEHVAKKELYLK